MKLIIKQQNQVAEITLLYNPKTSASELLSASTAEEAYRIFMRNWNADTLQLQEEFKVMLLNRANKVLGIVTTSCGGMNATVADPKLIFAAALKGAASSIIVAHNHPSGLLVPSQNDKAITSKLMKIGELLDIKLLDHIIVTNEGFYSFANDGKL